MIITQTPLRISFAGGGTDFREYYQRSGGCVLSTAIDKYIFVIVKERFDDRIRIGYSRTEMVDTVDEIEHELAREACEIEIDILGKPIGKQDQYIAAYGGLRLIEFTPDDTVSVRPVPLSEERRRRFGESLLLFYTGVTRKADNILSDQRVNIASRLDTLDALRAQTQEIYEALTNGTPEGMNRVGRVLDAGWRHKRTLSDRISNGEIDALYERALDAGAVGGKIAGAGGGGFLLLFCPPDRQSAVRQALAHLKELPFALERDGTKVILNVRR
jgi:D-glycero-alpha-D-manno-heptose-7-phosphate kinase